MERVAGGKASSTQAEKIGYVPRAQQKALAETGLSKSSKPENLDAESSAGLARLRQNDAEIDQGLDEISNSLDSLAGISRAMNDEVTIERLLDCHPDCSNSESRPCLLFTFSPT